MSQLTKNIMQLIIVALSCFSIKYAITCSMVSFQDGQFVNATKDSRIPDGSWILVGIERNGEDVSVSDIKKNQQVLLIKDDYFAIIRNDVRGLLGTVAYDKSQGAHDTVSFYETNPFDGTFNEYKSLYKFTKIVPGSNRRGNLLICRYEATGKNSRPTSFSSKQPGVIIETYRPGKL